MKKIFIVLTLLLAANFVFAESKFLGIPVGISQEEAEQNKRSYEEKLQKAFSYLCYTTSIDFYFTENETKQVYGFQIRFFSNNRIRKCFGDLAKAYLLDNKFKTIDGEILYNEEFVVITSGETINVIERGKFNNAMKSIMK